MKDAPAIPTPLVSTAPPASAGSPLWRRAAISAVGVTALAGGLAAVWHFPPSGTSLYPTCILHSLTGLHCPGCGGTRCVYALLHGNLLEAAHQNLLVLTALPFCAAPAVRRWWRWLRGLPAGPAWCPSPWLWWTLVLGVIGFGVLRNLPWPPFSWLAPR